MKMLTDGEMTSPLTQWWKNCNTIPCIKQKRENVPNKVADLAKEIARQKVESDVSFSQV